MEANRPGSLASRLAATTRVLAVEDDPDIAEFLRAFFRASGYDFVHVDPASVGDGMAALTEHRPDCVLLDMSLRGFSGLDLYRRIRSQPEFTLVPVIVVTADITARPRAATAAAAGAAGIDGFVEKPFNVQTLADIVEQRITAARRLAETGDGDDAAFAIGPAVLDARMADEIEHAHATDRPLAIALVTVRSLAGLRRSIGEDGLAWLVRELVAEAKAVLPPGTIVGRMGGDELIILLPNTSADRGALLLEELLGGLRRPRQLPGGAEVRIDPAAGIAGYPAHATDPDGLFMAADVALADALDTDQLVGLAL
jgi:PleD family two-component response regulator